MCVKFPGSGPVQLDLPLLPPSAPACPLPDWAAVTRKRRSRRGRRSHQSGLAAEEAVARDYRRRGCRVLAQRHRTTEGEIDLIIVADDMLVFVEVKRRKTLHAFDSPVSDRQWHRLGCAALNYLVNNPDVTCTQPSCRFDVALVDACGTVSIIENARTFD